MPDDALTILASIDPFATLNGLGLEPFIAAAGVLLSAITFVVGRTDESYRLSGPFAMSYLSFMAGGLQYYLLLALSGMDYEAWVKSFANPVTLLVYIAFLLLLTLIVKGILAASNRRVWLIACILCTAFLSILIMYVWCVRAAVEINGDQTDASSWRLLTLLSLILVVVPAILGIPFKWLAYPARLNRSPSFAGSLAYDRFLNTAVSFAIVIVFCMTSLLVLDVNRDRFVNFQGLLNPVVRKSDGEVTCRKRYNIALLTTEDSRYRNGELTTRYVDYYGEDRSEVGYKGYRYNQKTERLFMDASTRYTNRDTRRKLCEQSGYLDVQVCQLKDGQVVESTRRLHTDDGFEWAEASFEDRDGYSFCYENSFTLIGNDELLYYDKFETIEGAQGNALVGVQYDGDGTLRDYLVYAYDDSWNSTVTGWFNTNGQIEFVSYYDDNDDWHIDPCSNWDEFDYNLPDGVDRDKVHELFDSYFGSASPYIWLFSVAA